MKKPMLNIITNSNKLEFDFKYNKCKSLEEVDKTLPTLIIGYNNAKNNIKNFSILQKEYIDDNVWWTFNKTEKRTIYEEDIKKINNMIINNMINNIKYKLIDIINLNKKEITSILYNIYRSKDNIIIYNYFNKFLFVYNKKNSIIEGISLLTLSFLGKDVNKILYNLHQNPNINWIENFNSIPIEIRKKIDNDITGQIILYEYFC